MMTPLLDRRAFVAALLEDRSDLIVVSGLGSATYDVAAAGDHPLNVYQWGGMGGTAMIGLGIALAQPNRRVVVITGDGEMLMGLGSLATIGVKQPNNLSIIVLDNERYGETGMQASHTSAGVHLVAIGASCGIGYVRIVSQMAEVAEIRDALHNAQGPVFVLAKIRSDDVPRVLPTRDGHEMRVRLAQQLSAP